jgi:ABC-type transporter Mla MlaB component
MTEVEMALAGLGATDEVEPYGFPAGTRHADWRGDVVLELWIEGDATPARVRLAGRLDASTAANLDGAVRELLDSGARDIELCTDGLRAVDATAVGALADVERLVRSSGGQLSRVGPSAGPFARPRTGSPLRPVR